MLPISLGALNATLSLMSLHDSSTRFDDQKLVWKEMLYIRKLKPTLNIQLNAELHTYIIPKARGINDKISDIENYVKKFVPHKNITN